MVMGVGTYGKGQGGDKLPGMCMWLGPNVAGVSLQEGWFCQL